MPKTGVMRGQLRRDCDCFLTSNYFVSRAGFDRHMSFEKPYDIGANMGYMLTEGYTLRAAREIAEEVKVEYERRARLDDAHVERKARNLIRSNDTPSLAWPAATTTTETFFPAERWELDPRLREALFKPTTLRSVVTELKAGRVYAVPVFTEDFCAELRRRLARFKQNVPEDERGRPNSMNSKGCLLDEIPGATELFTNGLVRDVIQPLAEELLEFKPEVLDHHRAFSVEYDASEPDLALHFDNSEVTLNVHLGGSFDGGELEFRGDKYLSDDADPVSYANNVVGSAVLHLGDELHRAHPVRSHRTMPPSRTNLIVWARSTQYRVTHGCPMCGTTKHLRRDVLLDRQP
mmetsp:Transcript_6973/g.22756  ORF Transcript_6973/g.22756 Transcript_6973/m.22756 type:complete len:348 (-) Transcript_6973:248-1291(-)|eukprot:CAMPEP_0118893698 /NCGR_PEP_ID=MMETSP1166-20130328/2800_1 /TAXON_ID=1104430 /ORGANISM="Chrysoreinhardia sp, Strain CCMP3193" /LENGTH=347 /DNA_ID=CAMNT_0006832539 /DNA_START=81 /DNA_END=1124 /DNA_ORIENTATION=+